jgi:lipoyl(octanoyl) transferase
VRPLAVCRLGTVPYADAFALQRRLVAARQEDAIEDVLLLLEHPATITHHSAGRGLENLRVSRELLRDRGVALEPTDRGGNVTLHAPGQLVGYPILRLEDRDLHGYLRRLEEVLIRAARALGVETARVPGRTGTWLPDGSAKLAAIGVKVSRWVTLHGFAMNVSTDLGLFDLIVPCGIADAGVTSLARLGLEADIGEAADAVEAAFADVFGASISRPSHGLCTLLPP